MSIYGTMHVVIAIPLYTCQNHFTYSIYIFTLNCRPMFLHFNILALIFSLVHDPACRSTSHVYYYDRYKAYIFDTTFFNFPSEHHRVNACVAYMTVFCLVLGRLEGAITCLSRSLLFAMICLVGRLLAQSCRQGWV